MPEARNSTAGHTRPAGRARNIRRKEPKSTPETLDFQAARDIWQARRGWLLVPGGPPISGAARPRRGAGVVDRDGLENRCACKRTVGSNPTLSAIMPYAKSLR